VETTAPTPTVDRRPGRSLDAASALSALRMLVGAGTWAAPGLSWRTFGLGPLQGGASTMLVGRLFGVRDLALGAAVQHPDPGVRRAALQIGVAVDAVDVVATLLAVRRGAPKATLLLVAGGAALFVGLGLAALADHE
jgi:hypothetical protein